MKMQLSQQAEEIVGKSALMIITERVDDVALLIGQMVTMGLPEVLDRHIPRHGTQRGLSWGWTAVIWLAYIVTEGGLCGRLSLGWGNPRRDEIATDRDGSGHSEDKGEQCSAWHL